MSKREKNKNKREESTRSPQSAVKSEVVHSEKVKPLLKKKWNRHNNKK